MCHSFRPSPSPFAQRVSTQQAVTLTQAVPLASLLQPLQVWSPNAAPCPAAPGTLNFISGPGRATVPPVMRTGLVDVLGFIGGSKASDAILKEHPAPHRLRAFLQVVS